MTKLNRRGFFRGVAALAATSALSPPAALIMKPRQIGKSFISVDLARGDSVSVYASLCNVTRRAFVPSAIVDIWYSEPTS